MGRLSVIAISRESKDRLQGLEVHLMHNFYPPHTPKFAPLCAKAIEVYEENLHEIEIYGDFSSLEQEYKIPDIVTYQGRDYMTLSEVLTAFKLEPWLTMLEEE
jgi:hypothetical protein|tara:strand:+ start:359 stop:667 length:309 start_codon:yes stop_codon:yes gene_type:complete